MKGVFEEILFLKICQDNFFPHFFLFLEFESKIIEWSTNNLFTRNGIVQELVKSRAVRTFTIFLLLSPLPDGRQLSTKSYLLLPNGLCTLKMLGGCLSPLANLLPYCHESHPWKSLSLSLVSLSFFHGLSHALHLPSRQSSCLFPLIYPPPLRVTSPSFIARVTAFRRSNHEIISRYSSLSVGRRAAGFF